MADQRPTPSPEPAPALQPRTQFVLAGLLVALIALVGWHWYDAHYTARPTEQLLDPTYRIDLNKASRAELALLPNVGLKKADSIVAHRQAHGSFQTIDDLRNVHGIGDATVKKIRPWLTLTEPDEPPDEVERLMRAPSSNSKTKAPPPGTRINLNTATLAELDTLPNIGPVIAQRILDERAKKPFASVADLRRVSGIGPKRLEALQAYVTVD